VSIGRDICDYAEMRRVCYGTNDEYGRATFVPVCEKCGRFVKADKTVKFADDTIANQPNATCKKCGRVQMLFEGFL
jgi:hypothetical protein